MFKYTTRNLIREYDHYLFLLYKEYWNIEYIYLQTTIQLLFSIQSPIKPGLDWAWIVAVPYLFYGGRGYQIGAVTSLDPGKYAKGPNLGGDFGRQEEASEN